MSFTNIRTPIHVKINLSPQNNCQSSNSLTLISSPSAAPHFQERTPVSPSPYSNFELNILTFQGQTQKAQADSQCLSPLSNQSEEELQRQVEAQALQNLELREKLQQEKSKTQMAVSENLQIKEQLLLAQKKLKQIEYLASIRKSQNQNSLHASPANKIPSYLTAGKIREKGSQKSLRRPNSISKNEFSFSYLSQKKNQCSDQQSNQASYTNSKQIKENFLRDLRNLNAKNLNSQHFPRGESQIIEGKYQNELELFQREEIEILSDQSILDILQDLSQEQQKKYQIHPFSFQEEASQIKASSYSTYQNKKSSKSGQLSDRSDIVQPIHKMRR